MGSCRGFRYAFASIAAAFSVPFFAGSASAAFGDIPTSNVSGPIPTSANSYPFLATDIDLGQYGYVEEEYFLEGEGYRYDTPLVNYQTNANKIVTGEAHNDGKYPFKTRIVVRRPANPADANGIVVAEWNNVTSTQDVEFNWLGDPYFLLRNGYTFVGVTAQVTGVNSLKAFDTAKLDGTRYGSLGTTADPSPGNGLPTNDPGYLPPDNDPLSYDVFSSVVKALKGGRTGVDPLGGITATKVIASGESQSCGRLSTHYNEIDPTHDIVDAYLLTVCNSPLRTDRSKKAIRIITESENRTPRTEANLPDTSSIRHWEVAGGSHLPRVAWDNLDDIFTRDVFEGTASCQKFPLSQVKWPYTQNAAINALVSWSGGGVAPPIAPRGVYQDMPADPANQLVRDQYGIAQGGIRYPDVTVPTATNDGVNALEPGGGLFSAFCQLFGSSTPFSSEQLHGLYADQGDYLAQYIEAADAMVGTGFILQEDADRLKQDAREFARLRPSKPMLVGKTANRGGFQLKWVGTEAPDTTFVVQRRAVGGNDWITAAPKSIADSTATMANQAQGTHNYRVSTSTILPGTNISPAETVSTPFSELSGSVKVDRTGPQKPKIVLKGKRVKGAFKGPVRVKVVGKPDRKLPDGSAGVGLNNKSVPKTRTVGKKGKTVIKVRTSDKLGNKSPVAKIVIRIKR